jgi:hypothetical protein
MQRKYDFTLVSIFTEHGSNYLAIPKNTKHLTCNGKIF